MCGILYSVLIYDLHEVNNVNVTLSLFCLLYSPNLIRMCHLSVWAGFPERTRDGNKFTVAEKPLKQVKRNFCSETAESISEERRNRREKASHDIFDGQVTTDDSQSNLLDVLFSA